MYPPMEIRRFANSVANEGEGEGAGFLNVGCEQRLGLAHEGSERHRRPYHLEPCGSDMSWETEAVVVGDES